MRRIDAIAITVAFFGTGALAFWGFSVFGLDATNAGIWSQVILVAGLLGWVGTYVFRAMTQTMTYNQQLEDYKTAVLQKRLEEMTPEELAQLQQEVAAEVEQSKNN
jgi:hypothetical protein